MEMKFRIDEDELRKTLQEMIRIPSENPPGNEKSISDYLYRRFAEFGWEVSKQEVFPGRSNVIGILHGSAGAPRLMLNGHMDVVPPGSEWEKDPYSGEIVGDRIFGRGSSDMKGGLVSEIMAVRAIQRSGMKLKGDFIVAAVVDEETSQVGAKVLVKKGLHPDFAIIAEPTSLDICIAHKGSDIVRVTVHGQAAHGSRPDLGINAIAHMAEVVGSLQNLSKTLQSTFLHPILKNPSLNIGTISGGTGANVVPDRCTITVDRRWLPGERSEAVLAQIREAVFSTEARLKGFKAEVETLISIPPMEISPDAPIVAALKKSAAAHLGCAPKIVGKDGTTDASILYGEGNIPTVIFGPGDARLAHKPNEYVSLEAVSRAAAVLAGTAVDLLGG